MSEYKSIDALLSTIQTDDMTKSMQRVISSFTTNSKEIEELCLQVSLRCPLSQRRINIPGRGQNCNHLQCFDLLSYLQVNRNLPKFNCPVCSKQLPFKELVVDSYMKKILGEALEDTEEIQINPDGNWSIPKVRPNTKRKQNWGAGDAPSPKKQETTSSSIPLACYTSSTSSVVDLTT